MSVKAKHVARFLKHLVAAGGHLNRTQLSIKTLGGNYKKADIDEICNQAVLLGFVRVVKGRTCKKGRASLTRYILTEAGWNLSRNWQIAVEAEHLAPERIQSEFQYLLSEAHPWAASLAKDAKSWRDYQEQRRLEQEAKREKEEQRKKEYDERHPVVKRPSAGRNRSEQETADRKVWFAKMKAEQGYALGDDGKWYKIVPPTAAARPTVSARPAFQPNIEHCGAMTPARMGPPAVRPVVSPLVVSTQRPQSDEGRGSQFGAYNPKDLADIRKLNDLRLGFKTQNDCVWYNNSEWLQIRVWKIRNPGYID